MVEARGVEPLSENQSLWLSTSVAHRLFSGSRQTMSKPPIAVTPISPYKSRGTLS